MKILLTVLCLLFGTAYGQTIGYMRYDTVKIFTTKPGGRGSLDVTGNVRFTGLLPKSAGTDSVVVRDVNGNLGTTAKGALVTTPTWQQTLTAGSTLTTDNKVTLNNTNFSIVKSGADTMFRIDPVNLRFAFGDASGVGNATHIAIDDDIGSINMDADVRIQGMKGFDNSIQMQPLYWNVGTQYLSVGSVTDSLWRTGDSIFFRQRGNGPGGDYAIGGTPFGIYAPSSGGGLTVGTTTITSGTDTRVLYNNAGVLGEYPLSNFVSPSIQNFRLTTESGVPVSITDRTAQSTIYLTPYIGNHISLYSGAAWVDHTTAEISLALTVTSGNNYDVFAYNNAGTITLELSAAWTNDNTRADALTRQDGVLVKSGATTRRLIGTIRASASNVTEDSEGGTTTQVGGKRFVWNLYNQVRRTAKVIDQTDSWNYNTATWRQENGNAGNQIEYVVGDASILMEAQYNALVLSTNTQSLVGIGISSTTVPSGFPSGLYTSGTVFTCVLTRYAGAPGLGYFFIVPLEKGTAGTTTFYGDNATTDTQSGLSVIITN